MKFVYVSSVYIDDDLSKLVKSTKIITRKQGRINNETVS